MALNVSYFQQQWYNGIDSKTVKSTTKEIFENAQTKSTTVLPQRFDINLYNGEVDALTAKKLAMSGSGMQVTLNRNLETAIKFLQTKAAETRKSSKMADVISINSAKKDTSNPFYNGEVLDYGKKASDVKNNEEYLFITVA